jgi:hypothetical protein
MKEIPLDNMKEIKVEKGVVYILYNDSTTLTIKEDVKIIKGLRNKNLDGPLVDHCI